MIKSIVMHDIPISHVAAMERWYFREHAPEINPFVIPGNDFVSSFILERPNDEYWRDSHGYL